MNIRILSLGAALLAMLGLTLRPAEGRRAATPPSVTENRIQPPQAPRPPPPQEFQKKPRSDPPAQAVEMEPLGAGARPRPQVPPPPPVESDAFSQRLARPPASPQPPVVIAGPSVGPASVSTATTPTLQLHLIRVYDSRLPVPAREDFTEILGEAARILRTKFPLRIPVKIVDAGVVDATTYFEKLDRSAAPSYADDQPWRYDFEMKERARQFTDPGAQSQRQKVLQTGWSLEAFAKLMPAVTPRTYEAYTQALLKVYHWKMNWLASLTLADGTPLLPRPVPPPMSSMDWHHLLEVQDEFDIVVTNTLIINDVTHSLPPHSVLKHNKLGGGALPSPKRVALDGMAVMVNVFEEYGAVKGICRMDPSVTRTQQNRIIGAILLAHELAHALYGIPDVFDHGDACLMNSSPENLDYVVAYQKLVEHPQPCGRCEPWIRARMTLARARHAAREGRLDEAAALYGEVDRETPMLLCRNRDDYLQRIDREMLPLLEKLGKAEDSARCRSRIARREARGP